VRPVGRLLPLLITFALGLAGLLLPGPVGDVAAFVWLGVFPGMALARLLVPGSPAGTRWTVGVALSPLAASVAGWAIVHAGLPLQVAARMVGIGGWILFASGELVALSSSRAANDDAPRDAIAWAWLLGAAAFVALPPLLNPWTRVRSDTWVHAGIVLEIAQRGIPPQDPRFAGLQLNYVWFYNLFIALVDALRGSSPFTSMAVANVCWMAAHVAVGWQLAWSVWRERGPARAAVALLLLGLNAGALLLWPLWFVSAIHGQVTGLAEVRRMLSHVHFGTVDVILQLSAPFAHMVNPWDKYTVGTALGYAYLLGLVLLWAAVRWLGADASERGTWRWLGVALAAGCGTMLFHSVVGLSVIPVGLGACACLALLARARGTGALAQRSAWLAAALAAGLLVSWPYFRSISSGWSAARSGVVHHYFRPGWQMPWTLLTACGVAAAAAWPGLVRAWREQRTGALWLGLFALGMTAFACIVRLPQANEHKFVWQVFAPLAVLGGPGFPALLGSARRRLGTPLAVALGVVAFVAPSALFLNAYVRDPAGRTSAELERQPGERELYAWIRGHTPVDAVFADDRSRDVLLVEGGRRLLVGTPRAPDTAGFPADQMAHRRAVLADLYGPVASLESDAAFLDSLGAPAYVLYRDQDLAGHTPWRALEADSSRLERVYADSLGHRVYRLRRR